MLRNVFTLRTRHVQRKNFRNAASPRTEEKTKIKPYLVKKGLVEGSILSLQFMDLFIKFGLDVCTFNLQVLEGVDASFYNLW